MLVACALPGGESPREATATPQCVLLHLWRATARRHGWRNRSQEDRFLANSVGYHEDESKLSEETKDRHRAFASMMEELEATDWYDQRVEVSKDPELREILAHNRDEEKEHFVMTLEWLRRRDATLDAELREKLFTEGSLVAKEEAEEAAGQAALQGAAAGGAGPARGTAADGSLGIGSLRGGPSL